MFCPKCGNSMDDNARVCGRCGNPVAGNAQTVRPMNVGVPGGVPGMPAMPGKANYNPIRGNIAGFPVDWRAITFIGGILYVILSIVAMIGIFTFNIYKISMFGESEAVALGELLKEAEGEWGFGIFMMIVGIILILATLAVGLLTVPKVLSDDAEEACSWLGNLAIVDAVSMLVPLFAGINFKSEYAGSIGSLGAAPIVWLIIFILLAVAAKVAANMIKTEQMRQMYYANQNH